MRLSVMVLAFVCLCGVAIGIAATAQDDDVRGAFLTSRPKVKASEHRYGRETKPQTNQNDSWSKQPQAAGEDTRKARHFKTIVNTVRTCDTCKCAAPWYRADVIYARL